MSAIDSEWSRAEAAAARGRFAEAADIHEAAAERAPSAAVPHLGAAARLLTAIGRYDHALALAMAARARAGASSDAETVLGVLGILGHVRAARREWPQAVAALSELRRLLAGRGWDVGEAALPLAEVYVERGAWNDAFGLLEDLERLLTGRPTPEVRARATAVAAALLARRGELGEAEARAAEALAQLDGSRWLGVRAWVAGLAGRALAGANHLVAAGPLLEEALAGWIALGNLHETARVGLELAGLWSRAGSPERADPALARAVEALGELGEGRGLAVAYRRWTDVAIQLGRPVAAADRILASAPYVLEAGGPDEWAGALTRVLMPIAMHDLAAAGPVVDALVAIWPRCDPAAWPPQAVLGVARDLAMAGAPREGRALISARADWEQAQGAPATAAHLYADAALDAHQRGDRATARDLLLRALGLGRRLKLDEIEDWEYQLSALGGS